MRKIFCLTALLAVSGCGGGLLHSSEPPQTLYALRPALAAAPAETIGAQDVRIMEIARPAVPPGFNRDRIALYLDDGRKLDYFAGARWSARLEEAVQDFTRRSAVAALPGVVVITPEQAADADVRLQVKLNEFQPVYGADPSQPPLLLSEVEFTLISLPGERIITSFTLGKRGRASANRLDVVVAGLELMLQEIEAEAFERLSHHLYRKRQ